MQHFSHEIVVALRFATASPAATDEVMPIAYLQATFLEAGQPSIESRLGAINRFIGHLRVFDLHRDGIDCANLRGAEVAPPRTN
jgi:hypothetical protein